MKICNVHHVGGVDKIPPDGLFIGRPGVYGNSYSTASGKYSKEECVALHRVDLYTSLIEDKTLLKKLDKEMKDKDLYCFCVHPDFVKTCHGDNYLHILSPERLERLYDKSVVTYLMDDLRTVLRLLEQIILNDLDKIGQPDFLCLYLTFHEMKLEIEAVLQLIKQRNCDLREIAYILSYLVIDGECATREKTAAMILYRLDHLVWQIHRFMDKRRDRTYEPISPLSPLKRKQKCQSIHESSC